MKLTLLLCVAAGFMLAGVGAFTAAQLANHIGLNYLLGVEAWIIAPFFWAARSSVALMRAPFHAALWRRQSGGFRIDLPAGEREGAALDRIEV